MLSPARGTLGSGPHDPHVLIGTTSVVMNEYAIGEYVHWTNFFTTSLFLRALIVAIPNGIFAGLLCHYLDPGYRMTSSVGVGQVWSGYNFVLGFLVVFRTTHAYGRFWEGAQLLHEMRGEWFNAISCLFAFSTTVPQRRNDVMHFQNFVIRLASMLHCAALQEVSVREIKDFETLEITGLNPEALMYLQQKEDKCEVLLQWIQRLVVEAHDKQVVTVAPPILSRVFQELSRGIVKLNSAKRITDIPFPMPYGLMIRLMLRIQWVVTPAVCSLVMTNAFFAGCLSMITIFAFWSTVMIAAEIENPFGDDQNDLPLPDFQRSFNRSLLTLLESRMQVPPAYELTETTLEGSRLSVIGAVWLGKKAGMSSNKLGRLSSGILQPGGSSNKSLGRSSSQSLAAALPLGSNSGNKLGRPSLPPGGAKSNLSDLSENALIGLNQGSKLPQILERSSVSTAVNETISPSPKGDHLDWPEADRLDSPKQERRETASLDNRLKLLAEGADVQIEVAVPQEGAARKLPFLVVSAPPTPGAAASAAIAATITRCAELLDERLWSSNGDMEEFAGAGTAAAAAPLTGAAPPAATPRFLASKLPPSTAAACLEAPPPSGDVRSADRELEPRNGGGACLELRPKSAHDPAADLLEVTLNGHGASELEARNGRGATADTADVVLAVR